ncbi:MAG: hypothetical protein C4531_06140 [Desulfurivibrio sp.]|jgi:hypothetical protein|nr:MAG: hypothetical protein C4531_06140 [Desulfurivibrio sp.]
MKCNKSNFIFLAILSLVIAATLGYVLFSNDLPFSSTKLTKIDSAHPQTQPTILPKTVQEVTRKAESRIDPHALREADIAEVKEKAAEMKAQEEDVQISEPLTDVAPPPPQVDVRAEEHPYERLQKMNLPPPPQYQLQSKLPKNTDPADPPRWNETIAEPTPPTEAPDPFEPPPIKGNPARVPQE